MDVTSTRGTLRLSGVGKRYDGQRANALEDISMTVTRGEYVCVVGASGSGKSTLLSLIAGLTRPTAGVLTLDEYPVTGPGPDRGLVFQHGAIYPWRTVERNIAFGLELLPRVSRRERAERVGYYLEQTGLGPWRHALPKQLSGGQRQRVAIARALACEPDVLLLDEPFGALDVQTKEDMQVLIRQIWRGTGKTVVMVTHDVEEAVFLGQRVVVLASDPGRIAADQPVELPEDRDLSVKRTPEFLALASSIEDLVRTYHRRHSEG